MFRAKTLHHAMLHCYKGLTLLCKFSTYDCFPLLFFIQLLVMGIFIPRCLSNQNTLQSEHVELTVSILKS